MNAMGILSWILLGLIAGALAKFIIPGNDPGGCLLTIVIGIVGAFIGGYLGTYFGWGTVTEFDGRGILIATIGSVVFLLILRLIRGGR
jgi:uncharacterized membrane protein YeaQ/YmgE (transglycosylase-associated protein family)